MILVGIIIKSGLVLIAKKQIGYTSAQVTTDLRLALLRAMMSTTWGYFLHQPIGRLANSMASEAIRASQAYVYGSMMVALIIQSVVYICIALLLSWKATLASLVAGLAILFLAGLDTL